VLRAGIIVPGIAWSWGRGGGFGPPDPMGSDARARTRDYPDRPAGNSIWVPRRARGTRCPGVCLSALCAHYRLLSHRALTRTVAVVASPDRKKRRASPAPIAPLDDGTYWRAVKLLSAASPDFSTGGYYASAMARDDCVPLDWSARRTARVRLRAQIGARLVLTRPRARSRRHPLRSPG